MLKKVVIAFLISVSCVVRVIGYSTECNTIPTSTNVEPHLIIENKVSPTVSNLIKDPSFIDIMKENAVDYDESINENDTTETENVLENSNEMLQDDESAPDKTDSSLEEKESNNSEVIQSKIDLSIYYSRYSYSGLPAEEAEIVKQLLNEYSKYINNEVSDISIIIEKPLSYSSYTHVASFFAIYFSQFNNVDDIIDYHVSGNTYTKISINLNILQEYRNLKYSINNKINVVLSDFYEGTEQEKLKQIADYLKNNVSYDVNRPNANDALLNGVGNCNAFALSFQAMALRLGIQCDLCVGYTSSAKHAWNRVTLSTGEVLYYDISFYNTNGDSSYIAQSVSPWTISSINNYWV